MLQCHIYAHTLFTITYSCLKHSDIVFKQLFTRANPNRPVPRWDRGWIHLPSCGLR